MSVEEAYRSMLANQEKPGTFNLVLGAGYGDKELLQKVSVVHRLEQSFLSVAGKALGSEMPSFVAYDPLYKLDTEEIAWLDLDDFPDLKAKVEKIGDVENLALFEESEEFMRSLRFHVTLKQVADPASYLFFRQMAPSRQLKRSRYFGALMARGAFNAVEETMFLFDTQIDCFSDGRYMFIRNMKTSNACSTF